MEKTTRVRQRKSSYTGPGDRLSRVQRTPKPGPIDQGFGSMLINEREQMLSGGRKAEDVLGGYGSPSDYRKPPRPENPLPASLQPSNTGNRRQQTEKPDQTSGRTRVSERTFESGADRRLSSEPETGRRRSAESGPGGRQSKGSAFGARQTAETERDRRQFSESGTGSRQSPETERERRQSLESGTGSRKQPDRAGTGGRQPSGGRNRLVPSPGSSRNRLRQPAASAAEPADGYQVQDNYYEPPARKKTGSNFIVQGSILAAAGIIVRLIGMLYRIPLANYIGDEGNGYYSAAYNIYSILLILSSYSMPVAVSKMVSARLARKQNRNSLRILKAALFYATIVGGLGFCILWFGADFFAGQVIKMPFSSYALRVLAPTIWIMAYLGVLRGFFQGHSTMIPTAVSQVFEQIVNAVVSLLAAKTLFDIGTSSNLVYGSTEYSYAFGAAGGALGTGAGAFTALVLCGILFFLYLPAIRRKARREPASQAESYKTITGLLFFTVVPIIISSTLYNSSTVIDNTLFGQVMASLGKEDEIASQWGIYSGKYHLLFNIPVAVANSLSSSLIPSLSKAVAEKNRRQVLERISSAIRFSMIIAIPSAVGLTVLAAPVCNLLFSGGDNEMLIRMTLFGSSAVVVYSLSTVTNAVLQGINRMKIPIKNAAISMVLHGIILYVMLRVFHMGIFGVLYANILFALFICILNARAISRYKRYRQEIVKTFLIPLAASGVMGAGAYGMYRLCSLKIGNLVSTVISILAAVMIYFVLLIKLKGIDAGELKRFPGGTRLFAVARKLHLM